MGAAGVTELHMSWVRLPLVFGTLKIKPRRHLRRDELAGEIPVVKIGAAYFTWRPHRRHPTDPAKSTLDHVDR